MTLRYGSAGARDGEYTPEMGNIDIRDCTFANLTKQPIFIEGYDAKIKISGVTIANCTFQTSADKNTITNAATSTCSTTSGSHPRPVIKKRPIRRPIPPRRKTARDLTCPDARCRVLEWP